jgi:hypothetical protein
VGGGEIGVRRKKCIIMHVWGENRRKVHYSAVFGVGKRREKASNSNTQTNPRQDPGVKKPRRISFESTNLIGSSQDDGQFKIAREIPQGSEPDRFVSE